MIHIEEILNGWENYLDKSEVVEKEAKRRASICSKCEYAKKGILTAFIKDKLTEIQGMYCSACLGCPLSAKVRSKGKCEKNKW